MPKYYIEKTILVERSHYKTVTCDSWEEAADVHSKWDCSDPDSTFDNDSEIDAEFDDLIKCVTNGDEKMLSQIDN